MRIKAIKDEEVSLWKGVCGISVQLKLDRKGVGVISSRYPTATEENNGNELKPTVTGSHESRRLEQKANVKRCVVCIA